MLNVNVTSVWRPAQLVPVPQGCRGFIPQGMYSVLSIKYLDTDPHQWSNRPPGLALVLLSCCCFVLLIEKYAGVSVTVCKALMWFPQSILCVWSMYL